MNNNNEVKVVELGANKELWVDFSPTAREWALGTPLVQLALAIRGDQN